MEIPTEQRGNVTIAFVPVKELDAGNVDDFKRSFVPILESSTSLLMDLGRLEFIDSSGLGAILSCLRQLRAKGGDLKLCRVTSQVRSAFELVRMHRIFDILESIDEAIVAFAS